MTVDAFRESILQSHSPKTEAEADEMLNYAIKCMVARLIEELRDIPYLAIPVYEEKTP